MPESPLIAVVDDDAAIREAVQSLLRSVGLRVAVFASAEDFWQSAQRQATACLIADVLMPRMSGLELQRQLATARCPRADHLHHGPWRCRDARARVESRGGGLFGQTLQR
jgi:FixJ family two-component response regulator